MLLGLIMLVKAWGYYLGRFDLLTSTRGVVQGASYTDVNAQLPALNFLAIVAVICAILFFVNIRLRHVGLPVIAVVLLAVVSVLLGTAYPAFVQQFRVAPQEHQREQPYIEDNIEGTRRRSGSMPIDDQSNRAGRPAPDRAATSGTTRPRSRTSGCGARAILQENFQSLQRIRQYYDFHDVDVDRYTLANGERRVLMVSGREVTQAGIPHRRETWQNEHLVYTHGFGAVAAQVNPATTEGAPVLTAPRHPAASASRRSTSPGSTTARVRGRAVRDHEHQHARARLRGRAHDRTLRRTRAPGASRWATSSSARCSRGASATSTC